MVVLAKAHPTHDHHGYITNIGYIGRNHVGFQDTLSSKQFTTLIDVLSEGEIEGSATASKAGITNKSSFAYSNAFLKDVFLDGTQVYQQNAPNNDGEPTASLLNYKGVTFAANFGTSDQTHLPDVTQAQTEISVGTTVTDDNPVTVTVTNTQVNAVNVTVAFPAFKQINETDGTIDGTLVDIDIKLIQGNGSTSLEIQDTVIGKSNDAYFRDYLINFPANVVFPVQIRVERDKPDSTSSFLVDAFSFHSYTELIYQTRTYPDVAHTKLRFDSSISQKIPARMFRIRGIKVKIPHNATVNLTDGSITYSGTFNGTFKATKEWCSDPAWILYDILTNTRYGAGIEESTIDQYAFYSASVYNNERVDDGKNEGTTEPRFSCNVNINNSSEAFDLINQLATTMNVMPFYSAGSITISQDRKDTDPSYQFTLANVLEGGFTYSGSSQKTRHTVFNVAYFDMDTRTVEFETVEDTAANIAKHGSLVKNITAFACTSRNQSRRLGRWFLHHEQNATETVTFTATAEAGVLIRCGQIIQISDPVKANMRRGGRIVAGSTTGITVDDTANTALTDSNNAQLSVILSDGTLETRPVRTDGTGIQGSSINVSTTFSQAPPANSVWILETSNVPLTTWRIVSVKEEGLNYVVTALTHNPSKYDFIEDGSPLQINTIQTLTTLPDSPTQLSGTEEIVVINNKAVSQLSITWQPVKNAQQYRVIYRFNNGNPIEADVLGSDFVISNSKVGKYEIRVHSFNAVGEPSVNPSTITVNTLGKTAPPDDPSNLTVEPISEHFLRLRFSPSTSLDVIHGGSVAIRHTSSVNPANNTFGNSQEIIPKIAGNSSETLVPALSGTYSIKFVDDGGRKSTNAAKIIVTQPDPQPNQVIITVRDDDDNPSFQGNKVGTVVSPANEFNGLILDGDHSFDDIPDIDAIPPPINGVGGIDISGNVRGFGTYDFAAKIDLGAIFNLTLKRIFVTRGQRLDELIDDVLFNPFLPNETGIDGLESFDGTEAENVNAKLLVATTLAGMDPNTTVQATYSQSDGSGGNGTFVTIFKAGHGYSVGDFVEINFTADSQGRKPQNNFYRIEQKDTNDAFVVISDLTQTVTNGTTCSYGARFSQFNTFANGEFTARGFAIRAELASQNINENIVIDDLGFEASIKRRTETVNTVIASGTSAKTVTFQSPFFVGTSLLGGSTDAFLPSIGITLENAVSGDYFKITSVTSTQFVIEVRDINNNFKNLNFKYIAIGYGKGS